MKRRLASWLQRVSLLRWGLTLGIRLLAPRHHVGAVGVVFNNAGQVLLVEHVFRPNYNWGLPGGWVEHGESPADTVRRELEEELGLKVEVRRLLLCNLQGNEPQGSTPPSLGVAFYCRLVDEAQVSGNIAPASDAYEILSVKWVDLEAIVWKLTPIDQRAIALAREEFEREQKGVR